MARDTHHPEPALVDANAERRHLFRTTDKLHVLLKIACDDMEAVIADPRYIIDMNNWHTVNLPSTKGKCAVCLAGSVMAGTLQVEPKAHSMPEYFVEPIHERLLALDNLRNGEIASALITIGRSPRGGGPLSKIWEDRMGRWLKTSWRYHDGQPLLDAARRANAHLMLADLREMQRDLEQAGL